jgi:hypothetical protein
MIRKSVKRFSEKIMLNKKIERDDDSKKNHQVLAERIDSACQVLCAFQGQPTRQAQGNVGLPPITHMGYGES